MYKSKIISSFLLLGAFTQVFAQDLYQSKTITNARTKEVIVMKCLNESCGTIQFFAGQNESSLEPLSGVFDIERLKNVSEKEKLQIDLVTVENYETITDEFIPSMYIKGKYTPDVLYAGQVVGASIVLPVVVSLGFAHGLLFDAVNIPLSVVSNTIINLDNSLEAKKMLKKYDFIISSDGNLSMKTGKWKRLYNFIEKKFRVKS